jgi:hypothetical protein
MKLLAILGLAAHEGYADRRHDNNYQEREADVDEGHDGRSAQRA